MKIVHIITGLQVGGAESFLSRLLPRLSSEHSYHVVSLSDRGVLGDVIERSGIAVSHIGMQPGKIDPIKLVKLWRVLRTLKPDIVHTWLYHADLLGGGMARLAGVPTVMWNIRQSKLSPEYVKRSSLMIAKACAALSKVIPDKITCCATVARDSHAAMGYDLARMLVIPNGMDLSRFQVLPNMGQQARALIGVSADAPLIGMVARFDPQKNHRGFFEMAALVRTQRPEARFVLIGRDLTPQNPTVAAWIKELDLEGCLHLLGLRPDVERLLPALDILVSPSFDEGFPNAVAEAMACGCPCVVTDVGDSRYLVADTGVTVDTITPAALAEGVLGLLALPTAERQALGKRAAERIQLNFELGKIAGLYDRLYGQYAGAAR